MKLLEFARNRAFWMMDTVKGGKVRAALRQLQQIEGVQGLPEEQVTEYQEQQLTKLLENARKTVPFYADMQTNDLQRWPVVDKMTFRSNYDCFLSNRYSKDQLIQMHTSGSTGTPFTCYQDLEKKKHVNAETIFYNGLAGFSVGKRIIYLRSIVGEVQKTRLQQFAQNIYLLDCNDLSDEGIRDKLRQIVRLSRHCGAMMMGYASTFEAFRQYFERHGAEGVKDARIYGVVSGSEMLYDQTREGIEKAFRCKCFSRYANEENGFLGQDTTESNVFLYNRADYCFEILKMEEDEPAEEGEVGRIVITDLFNYAMPMIRYDTGDVGALVRKDYGEGSRMVLASFGGRRIDGVTDAYGKRISPHAITNLMWKHQSVRQFQFVQTADTSYLLRLNADPEEQLGRELQKEYQELLGENAVIQIEYTEDIPVLASGKRRYIVNQNTQH